MARIAETFTIHPLLQKTTIPKKNNILLDKELMRFDISFKFLSVFLRSFPSPTLALISLGSSPHGDFML